MHTRLITRNHKGQVEGVKYDRLTTILVNATKQQQEQIKDLEKRVKYLESIVLSVLADEDVILKQ